MNAHEMKEGEIDEDLQKPSIRNKEESLSNSIEIVRADKEPFTKNIWSQTRRMMLWFSYSKSRVKRVRNQAEEYMLAWISKSLK